MDITLLKAAIGLFVAAMPITRLIQYFYEARMYKYTKRIEVALRVINNKNLQIENADSYSLAKDIVNDSLFGIKFFCDVTGEWTSPVLVDISQLPVCNCSNAIGLS